MALIFIFSLEFLIANGLRMDLNMVRPDDMQYIADNLAEYESQCQARNSDACVMLGSYYSEKYYKSKDIDTQALELKLKYYTKGCNELRNGRACGSLGTHYYRIGDMTKKVEYYKKGCDYKSANSCNMLGHHYWNLAKNENDKSAKKQYQQQAENFYKKGCDLGDKLSCSNYKEYK